MVMDRKLEQVGWDEDFGKPWTRKEQESFTKKANKFLEARGERLGWKKTVIPKSIKEAQSKGKMEHGGKGTQAGKRKRKL